MIPHNKIPGADGFTLLVCHLYHIVPLVPSQLKDGAGGIRIPFSPSCVQIQGVCAYVCLCWVKCRSKCLLF